VGTAFLGGGAAVLVNAREGWYPAGAILFLIGVVVAFVMIGDQIRAGRTKVD
jgi:hypothetical protein